MTDSALATIADPQSPAAEAYRVLRGNILFSNIERSIKALLVAAPRPDASKSTLVANLGVVAAQSGSRVLVVDCDLRHPAQHTIFGLNNARGFSEYLFNSDSANGKNDYIVPTSVSNLFVMPSGVLPPNPAELLGGNRLAPAIERLKSAFDLVLFDAPPVLVVADTALLAARLDATVLAISANRTKRDDAKQAKDQLLRVHATILGVVMTDVRGASQRYGY